MKICEFNAQMMTQVGGIETTLTKVIKGISEKEQVSVVCGKGKKVFPEHSKANYFYYPYLKRSSFLNSLISRIPIKTLTAFQVECISFWLTSWVHFLKNDYDVIHVHQPVDCLFFSFLKKFRKFKLVLTIHGYPTTKLKKWMKNADLITSASNASGNWVKEKNALENTVIYNGPDTRFFKPLEKSKKLLSELGLRNEFILMTCARLTKWKGLEFALKAMPEILEKNPETRLVVVGEGNQESELKQLTQNLGLKEKVLFLGTIKNPELPECLSIADVFIQPNTGKESFSNSILDAMACGKAVIATNIGGTLEQIKHKENGLLVNSASEKEIAESVLLLMKDKELKKKIESNALLFAKRFDWNKIALEYVKAFKKLL